MSLRQRAGCALMVLALGGCTPASVPASGVSASAAPGSTTPSPARTGELTRPTPALPSVTSAAFSESYAANCDGRPGVDREIALLRSKGLIDGTALGTRPSPARASQSMSGNEAL